jgi:hypothetical protein
MQEKSFQSQFFKLFEIREGICLAGCCRRARVVVSCVRIGGHEATVSDFLRRSSMVVVWWWPPNSSTVAIKETAQKSDQKKTRKKTTL